VFLGRDYTNGRDYSDDVAASIDDEVRALISAAHEEARQILRAHQDAMERMVEALLESETVDRDEVARLFDDVPKWEHASSGSLRIQPPAPSENGHGVPVPTTTTTNDDDPVDVSS